MKFVILVLLFLISIIFSSSNKNVDISLPYSENIFDSMPVPPKDTSFRQISARITAEINAFVKDTGFYNASMSLMFYDPKTDAVIAEYNPNMTLIPASTMKIVSTATALKVLGKDAVFETTIQYDGEINADKRLLSGNIYIKGGGDPCLGSNSYKSFYYDPYFIDSWAQAIKNKGIDSIKGDIVADEAMFDLDAVPSGWSWVDIPSYYGNAAFGLSVYENRFNIVVDSKRKGKYLLHKDSIFPYIPDFYIENRLTYNPNLPQYLDLVGGYYSNYRVIKGNISASKRILELEGSIPDPPYLVAYQLGEALKRKGVKFSGTVVTMRQLFSQNRISKGKRNWIYTTYSPDLKSIVTRTNLYSLNLYAEHLLNQVGYKLIGEGSTKAGAEAIKAFWPKQGVNLLGFNMADGSGLSRENTITARQLVSILTKMRADTSVSSVFFNSLPVSGESGTMSKFGAGMVISGKIHAKTGTMSRVKSYAGYITTTSGKEIAFAIIINNFNGSSTILKQKLEKLLIKVYQSI